MCTIIIKTLSQILFKLQYYYIILKLCAVLYILNIIYKLIAVLDRVVDGGEFIEALGGFFGFHGCCP